MDVHNGINQPTITIFFSLSTGPRYSLKANPYFSLKSILNSFIQSKCPTLINKITVVLFKGIVLDLNKTLLENNIKEGDNMILAIQNIPNKSQESSLNYQYINLGQSYIINEYSIGQNDINKNTRLLNSYEAYQRYLLQIQSQSDYQAQAQFTDTQSMFSTQSVLKQPREEYKNERDIKECKIEIEGQQIPFSYVYQFKKQGNYKIKFIFDKNIKNISYIFCNCPNLISADFSHFNAQNVSKMACIFSNCDNLTKVNLANLNTSNATNMNSMFFHCTHLTDIDVSSFDTTNVREMKSMFKKCKKLKKLNLSNFNTQNVVNMESMFYDCKQLKELILSKFNTKNVVKMGGMFYNCVSLKNLDLFSFDNPKAQDMNCMFYNCSSLVNLNLPNFNTNSAINMNSMFYNCSSLINLNLSKFTTNKVRYMNNMFANCTSLANLDLSNFVLNYNNNFNNINPQTQMIYPVTVNTNIVDTTNITSNCPNLELPNIICSDNNLLNIISNCLNQTKFGNQSQMGMGNQMIVFNQY